LVEVEISRMTGAVNQAHLEQARELPPRLYDTITADATPNFTAS
jgi:hypothetical protein